jgi:hypothetical protein
MDLLRTSSWITLLAAGGLLLGACGLDPDGDEDGDGLTNGEEEELGTDPEIADSDGDGLSDGDEVNLYGTDPSSADSDGDGYEDGEEVESFTDPLTEADHPYLGGWPIDACRMDVIPTGNDVGDIAENFTLLDQFGEYVRFHDFCNHTIFLIAGAFT